MEIHLGVYALGSADAAERLLVEAHLPGCAVCRAELARLAPLPDLLARVPEGMLADAATDHVPLARLEPAAADPAGVKAVEGVDGVEAVTSGRPHDPRVHDPKVRDARARDAGVHDAVRVPRLLRGWRLATGAAVTAAAAGFAGAAWLLPHGVGSATTTAAPADVTVSAANPVTHVQATAALTRTSWGTSIQVTADGLPRDQLCWLVVRSYDGRSEVTGYWEDWSAGPVSVPASAAWRPSDISSVQVVTKAGVLVTVMARPAGPAGP